MLGIAEEERLNLKAKFSNDLRYMDTLMLADQQKLIYISSVLIPVTFRKIYWDGW